MAPAITMTGIATHSIPTERPVMMMVAGPVLAAFGDREHRPVLVLGVVLGDVDEQEGR